MGFHVAPPNDDEPGLLVELAAHSERLAFDGVWVAKQAASVDRLSGGRFDLGIGVGCDDEDAPPKKSMA